MIKCWIPFIQDFEIVTIKWDSVSLIHLRPLHSLLNWSVIPIKPLTIRFHHLMPTADVINPFLLSKIQFIWRGFQSYWEHIRISLRVSRTNSTGAYQVFFTGIFPLHNNKVFRNYFYGCFVYFISVHFHHILNVPTEWFEKCCSLHKKNACTANNTILKTANNTILKKKCS